jgi:superfamily II DNA or RNA helicase
MPGGSPETTKPDVESVLSSVTQPRLLDLSRIFGVAVGSPRESKVRLARALARELGERLPLVLGELGREELRAACRQHGLDDAGVARKELAARLLDAAGVDSKAGADGADHHLDGLPRPGQVVELRHRQWLVEGVKPGVDGESALMQVVCLDDDDSGRALEILWDLELGARIVSPRAEGLGDTKALDPPSHFGAYLHALKWSAVSAADASRFQAPFRAGIKLMAHQLTPLMKALELPRANLFIADDVGLGKTIEAGLVMQELLLRQQADFVLICCPASVCLQWRDEMQRRFGLRFEVMTREFVGYRRQDRGFGVNAWSTHNRFIISHSLLRRPEYRGALQARLEAGARKALLILDEAHAAAPASASKYAVDTEFTATIRSLSPYFDNRLFLSATPHNGHSNSFSALLEILDPIRFTRGVKVHGKRDLEPIMVRRLKRDLRKLGVERFPSRHLIELRLTHDGVAWQQQPFTLDAETDETTTGAATALATAAVDELELARLLSRYTALSAPEKGRGRLVFIHLQQRLLSSPEAFARSLESHAKTLAKQGASTADRPTVEDEDDDALYGESDEVLASNQQAELEQATQALPAPNEEVKALLQQMRAIAERARRAPDAKALALLAWMREHLCPAIGAPSGSPSTRWSRTRVILFTEYADTKRYLTDLLTQAIAETDDPEGRILGFHGGMNDEARNEVQRAFNASPDKHPVRILIATDAAREGVNLQAHCADLFHIDVPWNPSRLEQRNGRIDRTLQPADVVRCHYFVYPQRTEDAVLQALVRKVNTVQRELGSLGTVIFEQIEGALRSGVTNATAGAIETAGSERAQTAEEELEVQRKDLDALREEVERAGRRLDASRKALEVQPESLKGVIDIGLSLSGATALVPVESEPGGKPAFKLPTLDRSWDRTLDSLRPPRERDESFWEFRQKPPKPVTFHPLSALAESAEQLHLAHPFVKRILDRFLAQGFGAHDLSRVTSVLAPDESVIRVVAYARLTLFGSKAARLHDELVPLAAAWSGDAATIEPYKDRVTAARTVTNVEALLARDAKAPPAAAQVRIRDNARQLFASLWPALEAEADARAADARAGLAERARREADEMRRLLLRQKEAIGIAQARLSQEEMFSVRDRDQKRQVELDLKHLDQRAQKLDGELESEPAAIQDLYQVSMIRLLPVGLVVSYPELLT